MHLFFRMIKKGPQFTWYVYYNVFVIVICYTCVSERKGKELKYIGFENTAAEKKKTASFYGNYYYYCNCHLHMFFKYNTNNIFYYTHIYYAYT